jgi:flagellar biosynthesis GTPase FlhF
VGIGNQDSSRASGVFIPIVTPRAVNSHHCKFEFEAFLARERTLDRTDLVFPLLYISVPALENEAQWRKDPVLSIIGTRQYVDWRPFRHLDVRTTAVREAIERFCNKIVEALIKPWVSPEERRKQQQTEAQQRAEAARQAEEEKQRAEAARQAEEEKQRAKAARLVDEEKRRAQAARQAEEKRRPAEAARQAEDEPRRDRRPRRRSGETRPLGATANLAENDWIASFLRKDEKGFTISIRKGQESHVLELEITARLRDHLLLNQKIIKSYFTFGKRKEIITLPGHDDTIILEFVARD